MIITISGVPGSGKTTVATILSKRLQMPFYSIGDLRAKLAESRQMNIDELNAAGETDPTTDTEIDEYQREFGKTADNFIIEGRLSWYFIPHSFKVFLTCDIDEAAKRIFHARMTTTTREDEPRYMDITEAKQAIEERMASDARRYESIYGVDYLDPSHYDLIIDTTHLQTPEAVTDKVIEQLKTIA